MTAVRKNDARRRATARRASRAGADPHRADVGHGTTRPRPWTLAEMRRRWPNWHEDVERERQRRVERGQPPHIEDVGVLSDIAEVLRMVEARQREQAERARAERRRRKR